MKTRKLLSVILAALMLLSIIPITSAGAYSKEQATLTFTNDFITETAAGSGYSISGTTLKITAAGTYRIKGSCSEGSVVVENGLSGVTLIIDDLTLTSASTAPIVVKKSSSVLLKLSGTSTLTDNEDASTEETNADFEGAAIKVKSGSSLTIFGDGTLNAVGNAKNAIKGAAESSLLVDGGTIKASAVNNGIGFDGSIVINDGTFDITSGNDGIKSEPDEADTASAGTVTINGGTFTINAKGDGIQAAENLTINNGVFNIKTLDGYNSSSFNKDTMSCKGLKSSGNNDNETEPTNQLNITGGTFNLNTADDAVHSDGYVTITDGTFDIYTGDDGVHADATLTLGVENGYERDPEITIHSSYEGLEGSVVNAYSGKYYVVASDDGINAAGGSSNGSDAGQGGDQFRPGGGNRPGQGGQSSSGNYSLNIYGGEFYVNCTGDGLDSNGTLNLLGGDITVLSMQGGGDNSPIDADGAVTIKGATVFAAGSAGMERNLSASQGYYRSTNSYNANTVVNVSSGASVLRSEKLVRRISFLFYTSPDMTSNNASVSTASSITKCKSNAFEHNWDNGVVEKATTAESAGVMKYTCQDCGEVERKTIAKLTSANEYTEEDETAAVETTDNSAVYTATFNAENATVNVYYKQDYTAADETNVTTAIARNSDTGESDGSGSGQINFAVVPADGHKVDSVTVSEENNYNNLKVVSANDNLYRITKITGDLTVNITTSKTDGSEEEDKGCDVTFVTDENSSVNVYYTQDYKAASETNVTKAVSRNSTSGVADSTGDGQVNFTVVTADGYEVDNISIEGTYKNLKGPGDTGVADTYRVTKVQSALTITITTKKSEETTSEADTSEPTTEAQETTTEAQETTTEAQETTKADTSTTASTEASETTKASEHDATNAATDAVETTSADTTAAETTKASEATQATTKGVGAGTAFKTADKIITSGKTEEPAGATFGKLRARATSVKKKSITLKWNKVSGAVKYVIYANACGTSNKFKKLVTLSGSKTSYKVTKAAGKKLKKGKCYKFLIVAVNSKNKVISTAKTLHVATKGGKKGNFKTVTTAAKNNKVSLSTGKTFKLKAKAVKQSKKLKVSVHRKIKYESSNTKVVTVSAKGVITAKKKGTCTVYVYAQSGTYKKIKVTVK